MTEHLHRFDSGLAPVGCGPADLPGALAALLFRHDPIQIVYDTNADEYQPEAAHILTRLNTCHCAEEACRVVHEELVRSFGTEAVGSADEYGQIAREAWELWRNSGETG